MSGNLRMERKMVKELEPGQMEESMKGDLRMERNMVKDLKLILMNGGI